MNRLLTIFLIIKSITAVAGEKYAVGVRDYIFADYTRARKISTHIWYPIQAKSLGKPLNPKGPFIPVVATLHAPLANNSSSFPVVLISHGSMGLASRLFWLAEPLVKKGVIAIAVDHPGNMFGDSSADGLMRIWDRAKDLSFVLSEISKSTEYQNRIDNSKISAVGYSAGGTTVLLLAGARFSFDKFSNPTPHCSGSKDPFYKKQCNELTSLNPKSYGKDVIEGDYSDSRIKSIIALDPGFTRSFQLDSLKHLQSPLVFIADKLSVPEDEIFSKDLLSLLGPGQAEVLPDSVHMTFLAPCKPGLEFSRDIELKELCANSRLKLQIQKSVALKTVEALKKSWTK